MDLKENPYKLNSYQMVLYTSDDMIKINKEYR